MWRCIPWRDHLFMAEHWRDEGSARRKREDEDQKPHEKKWKQISTSGKPSNKETPHQIPSVHTHRIPTSQEIKRLNYFLNQGNDLPITFKNAYGLNQVPFVIWIIIWAVRVIPELWLKPESYSARTGTGIALGDTQCRRPIWTSDWQLQEYTPLNANG